MLSKNITPAAIIQSSIVWAHEVLKNPSNRLVWDSETTGLGRFDEMVSVAILNMRGEVLLDTLVRPSQRIAPSATRIHGISDEMVAGAPSIDEVCNHIRSIVPAQKFLAWSGEFDARMLGQSVRNLQTPLVPGQAASPVVVTHDPATHNYIWEGWEFYDLIGVYSSIYGDWSSRHGDYTKVGLPNKTNNALGNARATLAALQKIVSEHPL